MSKDYQDIPMDQEKFTISNMITVARILLIPVLVAILLDPGFGHHRERLLAVIIFGIASISDALDGYLARVRNEVTRLGKLLDPIADKLLISAAMISLVQLGYAPAWMIVIILGREFAVSGLRLIAASEGVEVRVSHYGKYKMIAQVIAVGLLIYSPYTQLAGILMLWVVMALAMISMVLYFIRFWEAMVPERKAQLVHRRSFKEIKEEVISTTRMLREDRFERKVSRLERRLEKARFKQKNPTRLSRRLARFRSVNRLKEEAAENRRNKRRKFSPQEKRKPGNRTL